MALMAGCLFVIMATAVAAATSPNEFILDMALQSVDDDYKGCSPNMTELLPLYLQKEKKKNDDYEKAWEKAGMNLKHGSLTENQAIALHIYTDNSNNIYRLLNKEVRVGKDKYMGGEFKYYSLHFLLIEAIQGLNKLNNDCVVTYRGTRGTYRPPKGEVRFGAFTSTSTNKTIALGYGNETCFVVNTCHGAAVSEYSAIPEEQEVLIPPYEKFEVVIPSRRELNCKAEYHLRSTGTRSNLRCALFGEGWRQRYSEKKGTGLESCSVLPPDRPCEDGL